jgi:hypothetical protein
MAWRDGWMPRRWWQWAGSTAVSSSSTERAAPRFSALAAGDAYSEFSE